MRNLTWKFTEYPKHLFVLGRDFDPEWAASAMYLSSFLESQDRTGRVVCPVHWRRYKTPQWWDDSLMTNPVDLLDLMEEGYRVWLWGVRGKTHWGPLDQLLEDRLRLQVVNYSDRNRWISDQQIRLSQTSGGVCEFILSVAGYKGDIRYLKQALEASSDASWFQTNIKL